MKVEGDSEGPANRPHRWQAPPVPIAVARGRRRRRGLIGRPGIVRTRPDVPYGSVFDARAAACGAHRAPATIRGRLRRSGRRGHTSSAVGLLWPRRATSPFGCLRREAQVDGEHRLLEHVPAVLGDHRIEPGRAAPAHGGRPTAPRRPNAPSSPPGCRRARAAARTSGPACRDGRRLGPSRTVPRPLRPGPPPVPGEPSRCRARAPRPRPRATACDAASARRGAPPGRGARSPAPPRAARRPTPRRPAWPRQERRPARRRSSARAGPRAGAPPGGRSARGSPRCRRGSRRTGPRAASAAPNTAAAPEGAAGSVAGVGSGTSCFT